MKVSKKAVGITASILGTLGIVGIGSSIESDNTIETEPVLNQEIKLEEVKICDGISVTEDCELDGIKYIKYVYHPATEEVFHYEKKIAGYNEVITGYCTLCNDGTRSPSCSTGSGTCSHHGGVKEWNAPIYKSEPFYEEVKIVDEPAKEEWYETIIEE